MLKLNVIYILEVFWLGLFLAGGAVSSTKSPTLLIPPTVGGDGAGNTSTTVYITKRKKKSINRTQINTKTSVK